MKLVQFLQRCVLAAAFAFAGIITVMAQDLPAVTIDVKNASLESVLKSLEGQTSFRFSFKSDDVDNFPKVTLKAKEKSLDKVLDTIFKGTGLNYNVVNNKVIAIVPGKAPKAVSDKVNAVGRVVDGEGQAVIGASVKCKNGKGATVTNIDGDFFISDVPYGTVLSFSAIGYQPVEKKWDGSAMSVVMSDDLTNLDEVVVVGYSSTTKRDLISSVSQVKSKQLSGLPTTNIIQGMAGRSPGVIITAHGGGVNARPTVSIRGGGTPLYVIDGVIRTEDDFANLAPDDIKDISILKDASATAVYGSRASNGIVQVTTRGGVEGRPSVDFDMTFSWSQPHNWPQKMHSYDRAYYGNLARFNDGFEEGYFSDEAIEAMRTGSDPENYGDTDWRKLVCRDWAPQSNYNVRVTGGSKINQYYISVGHIDKSGIYRTGTDWMKRTTFRMSDKVYFQPIGLHINAAIDGYYQSDNHPYSTMAGDAARVFMLINQARPTLPGVNKYGLPANVNDNSVAATSADNGYKRNNWAVVNGKADLVWDCLWVQGLSVRYSGNYRFFNTFRKNWRKDGAVYNYDSLEPIYNGVPELNESQDRGYGYTNQIFLEYNNQFGKHRVGALFGYEDYYEKGTNMWLQRVSYSFPIDQVGVGPEEGQTNGGSEAELGRAAWIGQVKYSFDDKYLVEGSVRHDGSDRFAPGHRWGTFFSGSIGWRVTQEKFMRALVDRNIFNELKIRASYGETGLDESAGRFQYLTSYSMNTKGYVVNGKYVPTFSEGALPSPDLTWYTTRQTDIGLDFSSLATRLYGSVDYFYYSTKGYLVNPTGQTYLNTMIGIGMPKVSSDSEFRREGVEFQLGWRDRIADFSYDVSANFTWYDRMWARIADEAESSYLNPYLRKQQRKENYYGAMYHNLGYYNSADEIMNNPGINNSLNTGYVTAGDIRYQDVNGDGKIDGNDQRYLGSQNTPHGQFGININLGYKGFYLTALFQGSTSFDMYIPGMMGMQTGQTTNMPVMFWYQTDFWTKDNRNAQYPRLMSNTPDNADNNYQSSDFWLVDGAYLRLKDVQFGYDFKYSVLKKVNWISRCKLGFSGQNIFTISQAKKYGLDPENGSVSNNAYPVQRVLAMTLNVGF